MRRRAWRVVRFLRESSLRALQRAPGPSGSGAISSKANRFDLSYREGDSFMWPTRRCSRNASPRRSASVRKLPSSH